MMEQSADFDKHLWKLAQARVGFKVHATIYGLVIAGLWGIWYFSTGPGSHPWPVWSMVGWGIGLAMHYLGVFILPKIFTAEKEYELLKRRQSKP
jgi:hypothetical protein